MSVIVQRRGGHAQADSCTERMYSCTRSTASLEVVVEAILLQVVLLDLVRDQVKIFEKVNIDVRIGCSRRRQLLFPKIFKVNARWCVRACVCVRTCIWCVLVCVSVCVCVCGEGIEVVEHVRR